MATASLRPRITQTPPEYGIWCIHCLLSTAIRTEVWQTTPDGIPWSCLGVVTFCPECGEHERSNLLDEDADR